MARRRVIASVLDNFLGTYVSRYSEFNGYWLFGYLVSAIDQLTIDLLMPASNVTPVSPVDTASITAVTKFDEQCRRQGLRREVICHATLTIVKQPGVVGGSVSGSPRTGWNVNFLVEARLDNGRHYCRERTLFVAPHDPNFELRATVR
jgi:hypothetical protein